VPSATSSAKPSTVSASGTAASSMCAYSRSSLAMPSRSRLRSADSRITLADSPSTLCALAVSVKLMPGATGRPPSLVATTISSPTPRLRRQRPSSSSLSPPWLPVFQNA
jgi:hypothetical protein